MVLDKNHIYGTIFLIFTGSWGADLHSTHAQTMAAILMKCPQYDQILLQLGRQAAFVFSVFPL